MNQPTYKWYVVNVNTISIDSGWDYPSDANDRAVALREEGGVPKVMTKPRVGSLTLDPNDDASWQPKRNNPESNPRPNPRMKQRTVVETRTTRTVTKSVPRRANPSDDVSLDIEVGSFWRKRERDPHRRVFKVAAVSDRGVIVEDVNDKERETMTQETFVKKYTRENPRLNPRLNPHLNPRPLPKPELYFFGSEYEAREFMDERPDLRETHQIRWRHKFDDFIVEPKDRAGDAQVWRDLVGEPRPNPSKDRIMKEVERIARTRDLDSARAEKVFEMWHKKEPRRAGVLDTGCDGTDRMVCVGQANDIVYVSGKWEKGRKTNAYCHTFDSKPKVWMLAHLVEPLTNPGSPGRDVESLLKSARNADGQFAVAELARPESFSLGGEGGEAEEIAIHSGAKLYGAVDKKTVIITDPHWRLIVVKGGKMHFDERGIVR